ncbi:MAG: hypothetical protein ACN6RK_05215 [Stenotrophomonas sp.]
MKSPYATDAHYDPGALERDRLFDRPAAAHTHLYCIHCERAYERGYFRQVRALQMCPYEGCDGDAVIDAWLWTDIADVRNPGYPAVPELGKVYPMDGHSA